MIPIDTNRQGTKEDGKTPLCLSKDASGRYVVNTAVNNSACGECAVYECTDAYKSDGSNDTVSINDKFKHEPIKGYESCAKWNLKLVDNGSGGYARPQQKGVSDAAKKYALADLLAQNSGTLANMPTAAQRTDFCKSLNQKVGISAPEDMMFLDECADTSNKKEDISNIAKDAKQDAANTIAQYAQAGDKNCLAGKETSGACVQSTLRQLSLNSNLTDKTGLTNPPCVGVACNNHGPYIGNGGAAGTPCVTSYDPIFVANRPYDPASCLPPPRGWNQTSNPYGSNGYNSASGLGNMSPSTFGQALGALGALNQLINGAGQCTISASPSQMTQPNQPVQLQWQSQMTNPQDPPYMVQISQVGNMPPTGYATVYPQGTMTYQGTLYMRSGQTAQCTPATVTANPNGTNGTGTNGTGNGYGIGTNGQPCSQPPAQPSAASCSAGTWKPISATGNGCTTGWQCVAGSATAPSAELQCQPTSADPGMTIGIVWSCGGTASTSVGTGFSTGNALSGSVNATASKPSDGSGVNTFSLACGDGAATSTASCNVQVNSAPIILAAVPSSVHSGESANIAWITPTGSMSSCTPSSPDLSGWTAEQAGVKKVNGTVPTPPLTSATRFVVTCTTAAGGVKTAQTTVTVQ
jgi:hypothetical protein